MPANDHDADLGQLIGGIYDAVIDRGLWPEICERVCQRFDFYNAMLTVTAIRRGGMIVNAAVNVPPAFLAVIKPQHTEDIMAMWGGAERVAAYPLEEPAMMSNGSNPAEWTRYDYFNVFAVPQGINDVVAIALASDQSVVGTIAFGTHVSRRPVSPEDMAQLRIIAPHFRRAVRISGILDDAHTKVATFGAALAATASGVIVVDADGRILHANAVAELMLAEGDPIKAVAGSLQLGEELVPGQLSAAIRGVGNEATLGRRGMGIPAHRRDGSPLTVTVMPLARRTLRGDVPSQAAAAILVTEGEPLRMPVDALSLLYDLTPAEVRVFELVVDGHSNIDTAKALGLSLSTVKSHMVRVLEKTGARNRVSLANLAHKIRLPG